MPTVISHPAVAFSLLPWFHALRHAWPVLAAGMVLTVLPDIDVLAFRLGIPYRHVLGHRGLTLSIFFAVFTSGVTACLLHRVCQGRLALLWAYLFVCAVSHGLLDALTDGGLGIAFFAPFSNERYFFPFRPLAVSPIGLEYFLSPWGWRVLASEFLWLWTPAVLLGALGTLVWARKKGRRRERRQEGSIRIDG